MKRRKFIQTSVAATTSPLIITGCNKTSNQNRKRKIKGFIFSDAHIGWNGKAQPTLDTQKSIINTITKKFSDLDLVFDTGDVHHGNLKENQRVNARAFWLSEMAGKFPKSLFHYIPGNHELGSGLYDAELTVGRLGSFALRPYYSFDYNGIHFISLPQLQDTILLSQESLNWLQIDLDLNKDKTTLVFSHNSLDGTTFNSNATGYRVTVNSDQVTNILNKHNNVIGWFHGHNHQYQIVKKGQRLYVSNGRIGGFNPPDSWGQFGQGHLGGIYFEIDSQGLTVKCFSATKNDFFENLGMAHLSDHIAHKTSFDPNLPVSYYWGHGMVEGNNTFEFNNHYLSNSRSTVLLSNNLSRPINANHDFRYGTEFRIERGPFNKLIGYSVEPKEVSFDKVKDGVLVSPADKNPYYIKLPIENYKHGRYLSRSGYYRCGLGAKYLLSVLFDSQEAEVQIKYKVLDIDHKLCYQSNSWLDGETEQRAVVFDINIPRKLTDAPKGNRLYLFITVRFNGTPILLKNISLYPNGSIGGHKEEQLTVLGKDILTNQNANLLRLNHARGEIKAHDVVTAKTLYIKTSNIKWQVRNATATLTDKGLIIHELRGKFADPSQVIITPTIREPFYVNELINISKCEIWYSKDSISITVDKKHKQATLIIISKQKPSKTGGVELTCAVKDAYYYKVLKDKISISFNSAN